MLKLAKPFIKPLSILLIASSGILGLTSCSSSAEKNIAGDEQMNESAVFDPELVIEETAKPTVKLTLDELTSKEVTDIKYQTNISLEVPKEEYTAWVGTSSEPVIANFVSSDGKKAPYIEGLMSGSAVITITNTETEEEYKINVNVINEG